MRRDKSIPIPPELYRQDDPNPPDLSVITNSRYGGIYLFEGEVTYQGRRTTGNLTVLGDRHTEYIHDPCMMLKLPTKVEGGRLGGVTWNAEFWAMGNYLIKDCKGRWTGPIIFPSDDGAWMQGGERGNQ